VLRDIFVSAVGGQASIIDEDQLDLHILEAKRDGFESSISSCLVLLVLAIGALYGKYPEDERRLVPGSDPMRYTMEVPESRMSESSRYFTMAQRCLPAVMADNSLVGAFCFTGIASGTTTISTQYKPGRCFVTHPCCGSRTT
jgi:hypothetical protein